MPQSQYLENKKLFTKTDIFLASYPRSGNTWMRLLLSDAILQLQGCQTNTGGNIIPDIYKVSLNEWNKKISIPLEFRIIKTHEPLFVEKTIEIQNRVIYLFRNPADSLCSYYHYLLRYEKDRENKINIDNFCLDNLDQWCQHLKTYIDYKKKYPECIIFISYEKMSYNSEKILNYVLEILGWDNCKLICKKAVQNQQFQKLKKMSKLEDSEKMGFWEDNGSQDFFRKGIVNSSQEELSSETLRIIEEKGLPIYQVARSLEPIFPFEFSGEIKRLQKPSSTTLYEKDKLVDDFAKARRYYRSGELEKAISTYRRLIEIHPQSSWSYYNLGNVLGKINIWDEAIVNYRKAIEINPNSSLFHYSLATALIKQGNITALIKQGNIDEAVICYQKAISLKPDQSIIQKKLQDIYKEYHDLAEKCFQENNIEEAMTNYQKAIQSNPNFAWSHLGLGKVLYYQDKVEDAISYYRKAIELNPNVTEFYHWLEEALKKQNN